MEQSLSFEILTLLPHLIMALGEPASTPMAAADQLSLDYYARTCQNFEAMPIVDRKIKYLVSRDYTLAASLIRLHFHDCAVRSTRQPPLLPVSISHLNSFTMLVLSLMSGTMQGCDGSILPHHLGSERRAKASETLRGFEVIDDIKAEAENKCSFFFSPLCLDHETSGSHTIGRCTCDAIQRRLCNFNGTGKNLTPPLMLDTLISRGNANGLLKSLSLMPPVRPHFIPCTTRILRRRWDCCRLTNCSTLTPALSPFVEALAM